MIGVHAMSTVTVTVAVGRHVMPCNIRTSRGRTKRIGWIHGIIALSSKRRSTEDQIMMRTAGEGKPENFNYILHTQKREYLTVVSLFWREFVWDWRKEVTVLDPQ
jgi:hypothetical protein